MNSGFGWAALALLFGYLALFLRSVGVAGRSMTEPVLLFTIAAPVLADRPIETTFCC